MDRMRVKMFLGININDLESEINSWLEHHKEELTEISTIKQSASDKIIIISIWYFDKPKEDPRN